MGQCLGLTSGGEKPKLEKNAKKERSAPYLQDDEAQEDEVDVKLPPPQSKPAKEESKASAAVVAAPSSSNPPGKKEFSWNKKKGKLNRKDFLFESQTDKFCFKNPGQLKHPDTGKGMDFNIRFCKQSKLYVHDQVAEVKIDQCQDCEIVVGPTMSSVFVRDCENSKFIITCK